MPESVRIAALCLSVLMPGMALGDVSLERSASLERLVIQDCGSCHGLTLNGGLGTPITTDRMQYYDRTTLRDIILDGIPGSAMPPWRPLLSDSDALWIADYLRTGETK